MEKMDYIGKSSPARGAVALISGFSTLAASVTAGRLSGGSLFKYIALGGSGAAGVTGAVYFWPSGKKRSQVAVTDRVARSSLPSDEAGEASTSSAVESSESASHGLPRIVVEYRRLAREIGEGYSIKIAGARIEPETAADWTLADRMELLPHLTPEERRPMLAVLLEEAGEGISHRGWARDHQAIVAALKAYFLIPGHIEELDDVSLQRLLDIEGDHRGHALDALARRNPQAIAAKQAVLTTLKEALAAHSEDERAALIKVLRSYPAVREQFGKAKDYELLQGLYTVARLAGYDSQLTYPRDRIFNDEITSEDIHRTIALLDTLGLELPQRDLDNLRAGPHHAAVWAMVNAGDFSPLVVVDPLTFDWEGVAGKDGCRLWMVLKCALSVHPWVEERRPVMNALLGYIHSQKLTPNEIQEIASECFEEGQLEVCVIEIIQILRQAVDNEILHAAIPDHVSRTSKLRAFGYGTEREAHEICQALLKEEMTVADLMDIITDQWLWKDSSGARKRELIRRLEVELSRSDEEQAVLVACLPRSELTAALLLKPTQLRQFGYDREWMIELADRLEDPSKPFPENRFAILRLCRDDRAIRRQWISGALAENNALLSEVAALTVHEEDFETLLEMIRMQPETADIGSATAKLLEGLHSALPLDVFQRFVGRFPPEIAPKVHVREQ